MFHLCVASLISLATGLSIRDNRYDGLLIAIHPDIPEDRKILEELTSMVTDASGYLYQATKNRAFFGSVGILIPDTWRKEPSWPTSSSETFEEAHVRIDQANPTQGNNPYTFQPRQCGEPGEYIHLTPDYVLDKDKNRFSTWGNPGRTLVHEFSHLRYGVFDEYGLGNDEHPNFYLDENNMLYPTACPRSVNEGRYFEHGKEVEKCEINPETNLPSHTCNFVPDVQNNSATASVMYDQAVNNIFTFCESRTSKPGRLHNPLAPNRHNKMCNGKGTWDIVSKHPDFAGKNQPITVAASTIKPTVSYIYNKKQRLPNGVFICGRPVVLVLDLSGSMANEWKHRYFKQTQTADKLIRDILPTGTMLGIVTFSGNATEHEALRSLASDDIRDKMAKRLPKRRRYGGGTAIGKGLLKAKELLVKAKKEKEGRIVLITDGEENTKPFVARMKGEITNTSIKVHSIAYSAAAASAIKTMSEETGGQYAYYSESPKSTALDSVMQGLLKDISICKSQNKIEIMRKAKKINPPKLITGKIEIDSTVGNDTMFVFTLPYKTKCKVTLQGPHGQQYSTRSPEYSSDPRLNIVRYKFPKAENGTWRYTVTCQKRSQKGKRPIKRMHGPFHMRTGRKQTGNFTKLFPNRRRFRGSMQESVTVVVKALPTEKHPYEVDSWLSTMSVNPKEKKPAIAYVHVRKGYSPVNAADVAVTVERPGEAKAVKMKLNDDGATPDNTANDGVYTAVFTNFTGNKRYSWDVDVKTEPEEDELILASFPKLATLSRARSRYQNGTPEVVMAKAERFTRTSSCGAMDVSGYKKGKDYYAPSRISDLRVVHSDSKRRMVTLTWTAPGDDLNAGRAKSYDIRILRQRRFSQNDLLTMFLFGSRVKTIGSLKPNVSGTKEKISVLILQPMGTCYLAIRTQDDANHFSEISNVVTTSFQDAVFAINSSFVSPSVKTTTTLTTTTISSTEPLPEVSSLRHKATVTFTTQQQEETVRFKNSRKQEANLPLRPLQNHNTDAKTEISTVMQSTPVSTTSPGVADLSNTLNTFKQKTSDMPWLSETIDDHDKKSGKERAPIIPNTESHTTRKEGPSPTLIGIIVSSTVGLVIVAAVVAVVVSKVIVTRVHAVSDMSTIVIQLDQSSEPLSKQPRHAVKPPRSPLSVSNLL